MKASRKDATTSKAGLLFLHGLVFVTFVVYLVLWLSTAKAQSVDTTVAGSTSQSAVEDLVFSPSQTLDANGNWVVAGNANINGTLVVNSTTTLNGLTNNGNTTATGTIYMANGNQTVPSLTYTSNPNTGFFLLAPGQLALTASGQQVFYVQKDSGGRAFGQLAMNGNNVSNVAASIYGLTNDSATYVMKLWSSTGVDLFDFRANGQFVAAGTVNTNTVGTAAAPGLSIFNADGGLYRPASGVMGIASNGLGAGQIDSTQNWQFAGTGGVTGTNTGSFMNIKSVSANTTLSGATTTVTTIPAGALVMAVTCRVTTVVTGATTWSIGDGTTANRWANAKALTLGTTSTAADYAASAVPALFTGSTNVVATANGSNFTGGVLRCVAYYFDVSAPTG